MNKDIASGDDREIAGIYIYDNSFVNHKLLGLKIVHTIDLIEHNAAHVVVSLCWKGILDFVQSLRVTHNVFTIYPFLLQ